MFLRQTRPRKDGKTHTCRSVVENRRLQGGRVVQRHVLYLGEISPSQAAAWRKSIEVFDDWLAGQLWEDLHLDRFRSERLPVNRKGTRWIRFCRCWYRTG